MGFFENEREFRNRAKRQKLSTACQAAFYAIIGKFNDANWAEEIDLTDSELMRLTQIRSSKTITDVKSRLKLSGIIDFRTSKYYGTTYKLVQLTSTPWCEQQNKLQCKAQSKVQTTQQSEVRSKAPFIKYTLNKSTEEDVEDGKDTKNARVCVSGNAEYGNLSEKIKNAWIARRDYLSTHEAYELRRLEIKVNDTDLLERAIREATTPFKTTNTPISFLEGVLRNKAAMKESESKNDRREVSSVQSKIGEKYGSAEKGNRTGGEFDYKWELPENIDKYLG